MEIRDLFVATVAITIGVIMLHASIWNQGWCFQMKVARVIEESKGRESARTFIGTVGTTMMLLGFYLLLAPWIASQLFQSTGAINLGNSSNHAVTTSSE